MKKITGQSLVEFIIAIGVSAIFLPALLTGLTASRNGKAQEKQRLEAITIAKETEEAVRVVREKGWSAVAPTGTYHPIISNNSWSFAPNSDQVNGFTRSVLIESVYRNTNGQIVPNGGTLDASTIKATTTVSWGLPYISSINSIQYLTRYQNNASFIQTSKADFDAGLADGTVTTDITGGEVTLALGGHGLWCSPVLTITAVDLPKNGVANAISAVEGLISAATGENAAGVSYASVGIDNNNPPNATVSGTFNGYKTNDLWTDGHHTYIATDNNHDSVVILDVSVNPPVISGVLSFGSSLKASRVFVSGGKAYVTTGSWLYVFDVATQLQVGNAFQLLNNANATGIVVNGNYAYVSLDLAAAQLEIIDVTDPSNMKKAGSAVLNGLGGNRLVLNNTATRAYIVTATSAQKNEFFIVDISAVKDGMPTIKSYDTNGMDPLSVALATGNKAIIVGTGGIEQYQVVDMDEVNGITHCGGLPIPSGVRGVSTVIEHDGDVYSYIITGDSSTELKIIEGGPGGRHTGNGNFYSSIFDQGFQVAFNRLDFNINQPQNTQIKFQVAGADLNPVSGSCSDATYTYVGPDGTGTSYFTQPGPIPTDDNGTGFENPARCFRYKAILSTADPISAPVLYDITVNYSP